MSFIDDNFNFLWNIRLYKNICIKKYFFNGLINIYIKGLIKYFITGHFEKMSLKYLYKEKLDGHIYKSYYSDYYNNDYLVVNF